MLNTVLLIFSYIIINSICSSLSIKIVYDSNDGRFDNPNDSEDKIWQNFLITYERNYSVNEMERRRNIFNKNIQLISTHNEKYASGKASFKLGINHFADLTQNEIAKYFTANQLRNHNSNKFVKKLKKSGKDLNDEKYDLPKYVNWVNKNAVTAVKDQKQCGSCYAFGALGSLEGQYAIKNKKLVAFSEQNIIDCSRNGGCTWGNFETIIKYIKKAGGIDTQEQYPYIGKVGKCNFHNNTVKVDGYQVVKNDSEYTLQRAVAEIGPITVGLDASSYAFHYYLKGVLHISKWSKNNLNHAAVVVGYGVENKQDYWLIKNSWSARWGDKGYLKLARNKNNTCGITLDAEYPILP